MARKTINEKNLSFLLYTVFNADRLIRFDRYAHHNKRFFDMALGEAVTLSKKLFAPSFEEMDRHPPSLENGRVRVHEDVRKIMQAAGEGGWISSGFPEAHGGDLLPELVNSCIRFTFAAANYSASVYPELTGSAARVITAFGNPDLIRTYVPQMLAGNWQGTMALTEPQAGSSLSDITTTATPADDGRYRLKGRKVFISAGDHDGVDNVVHLMLAKVPGAPSGVKGISLFVVPKFLPGDDGLIPNDVVVSQVYHKLGYRGTPITELAIGDRDECTGFLLGEENKGLSYMFQMMNEARLGVGLGACAIASAAYYTALDYASRRPQGRRLSEKDPALPQVPIIAHADVKRMLLFQKSVVEGSLGLLLQCALYADLAEASAPDESKRYELLLDILTPVAKTYASEMGILSTSAAIQCLGGYGYCEDFPVEQHFRDMRIHTIHEGTTGIQGMDLLGRKVIMKDGAAFKLFLEEVENTIEPAMALPALADNAGRLKTALADLTEVTQKKISLAMTQGPEPFLADASLYLEMFGIVTIAWQWLKQAIAAETGLTGSPSKKDKAFFQGKLGACTYFFSYELPRIAGLKQRLMSDDFPTLDMDPAGF